METLRASTCSASKLARPLIKLVGKSRPSLARARTKSFSRLVELKETTSRLAEFAKRPNRKTATLLLRRSSIRQCADQLKSWKRTAGKLRGCRFTTMDLCALRTYGQRFDQTQS